MFWIKRVRLETEFNQLWYSKKSWVYWKIPGYFILKILSMVYGGLIGIQKIINTVFPKKKYRAPVPVVIVGNITVGGTGKTPFLIELIRASQARGFYPAVISRGYGRKNNDLHIWTPGQICDPSLLGDEPCLIAEKTGCPMAISKNRNHGIQTILQVCPDINIIFLDDGLQRQDLYSDLNICLVDTNRQFGNQNLLPFGPLREPLSSLKRMDWVVYKPSSVFQQQLDPVGVNLLDPTQTLNVLDLPDPKTVHAIAGIGCPENFFRALELFGLRVIRGVQADHSWLTTSDLMSPYPILITEKDAIKLTGHLQNNYSQIWVVRLHSQIATDFQDAFFKKLQEISISDGRATHKIS